MLNAWRVKIWGELDIKKSGPRASFLGIIYTIKQMTQTKFTQQQVIT